MIFIRSIRCQNDGARFPRVIPKRACRSRRKPATAAAAAAAAARFEKARDIIVPIFALIEVQSCKIMS